MLTQDQQNWNHIFITFLAQVMHFTRLKTFKKHLFSSILFSQKNTRNSAFHIFINTTLHEESYKIDLLNLDTYSSRYDFPNLAENSVKE